nr:hypothetical protein [Tanacetum cinerariifolium]
MPTNERGELATWDGGNITWGGRVGALGSVPLCVCAQEMARVRDGFLSGKGVKVSKYLVQVAPLKSSSCDIPLAAYTSMDLLLEPSHPLGHIPRLVALGGGCGACMGSGSTWTPSTSA